MLDIGGEMWKVASHHRMGTKSTFEDFKVSEIISKLKMSSFHHSMSSIKVRIVHKHPRKSNTLETQKLMMFKICFLFQSGEFLVPCWFSGV